MVPMTKDDIMKLEEGDELDILMATEIMEWHLATNKDGWKHWVNEKDEFMVGTKQGNYFEDEEDLHILNWHPSHSFLWMEQVIDKMKELGWNIVIYNSYMVPDIGEVCGASFGNITKMKRVEGYGTTIPLSVCRAALLTKLPN